MQKTFTKYTIMIMTAASLLILFINFLFNWHTLEAQQYDKFQTKIEQVIHTLENNRSELSLMRENLDEDYLTRARAAAYVLDRQEEVELDVSQMQYLAKLLNVDEVHVIDESGFIVSSSVSQYVGIDMSKHKQTNAFMALLTSEEEGAYLIQEAQPNAAEGKIMQYVGVARKEKKGIVQVGFEPKRQLEAQSRNTYDYIFSRFPTEVEEEIYVIDVKTADVLGHSASLDRVFEADCYQLDHLLTCAEGAFQNGKDSRSMYVVSKQYDDVLICAAIPWDILYRELLQNGYRTLSYLLFIMIAVVILLNYLVKKQVINGIHRIIDSLGAITNGNLDTEVSVGGNREFEELSGGINTMVHSIVSLSDRISAIIEMSGIPLAAFEYEKGGESVFVTSGLGKLLEISDEKVAKLCRSTALFDAYIRQVTKETLEDEEDVCRINEEKYVRIHMSESESGKLGVITDVTEDIKEKMKMRYENTHDPLTGLYKYQYFKKETGEILKRMPKGKVCAAVMLDLDHFKSINDTYGHDAGDRYLQTFAAVMSTASEKHFLTARRSGDEFSMFLFDCNDRVEVAKYLDAFYDSLRGTEAVLSDTEKTMISVSGGFACTADPDTDISVLLSCADEALYEVKRDTKGTYREYRDFSFI